MKSEIEQALQPLAGEPLWAIGRAGGVTWFQFGERRLVRTKRGESKEVGTYALHLQCPWTWRRSWGEVIADQDMGDEELASMPLTPVTCHGGEGRDDGAFRLTFDDGSRLLVEPVPMQQPDEYDEFWRLVQPSTSRAHFVVRPTGIDRAV